MSFHLHLSRGHSAGFLTYEAVVTYPFHPLVGQTVLVTGDHEHDGVHYLLIRQPHGGSFQIPGWMFDPAASSFEIVAVPRLPASRLIELRAIVDHLVASPLAEESREGIGNGNAVSHANGSVHRTGSSESGRHRSYCSSDDVLIMEGDFGEDPEISDAWIAWHRPRGAQIPFADRKLG